MADTEIYTYNKTEWDTGMIIDKDKMNNLEEGTLENNKLIHQIIEDYKYQPITIKSFTVTDGNISAKQTLNIEPYSNEHTFTYTCKHNKNASQVEYTITTESESLEEKDGEITYTRNINPPSDDSATWTNTSKITITANDSLFRDPTTDSSAATINFIEYCYYGVVLEDPDPNKPLEDLSSKIQIDFKAKTQNATNMVSFSITPESNGYICCFFPVRHGNKEKAFIVNSVPTDLFRVKSGTNPLIYNITNTNGFSESYYCYKGITQLMIGSKYNIIIPKEE